MRTKGVCVRRDRGEHVLGARKSTYLFPWHGDRCDGIRMELGLTSGKNMPKSRPIRINGESRGIRKRKP